MATVTFRIIDNNNRPDEVVFNGFAIDHDLVPVGTEKQTKWAQDIITSALRETAVQILKAWNKQHRPQAVSDQLPTFLAPEEAAALTADMNRHLEQWATVVGSKPAKFFIDAKLSGVSAAGQLYKAAL